MFGCLSVWSVSLIAQFPSVWSVWLLTRAWLGQLWSLPHLVTAHLRRIASFLVTTSFVTASGLDPCHTSRPPLFCCSMLHSSWAVLLLLFVAPCFMPHSPSSTILFVCYMPMLLFVLFGAPCCMLHVCLYSVGFVCCSMLYGPCQLSVCCPLGWIRNRWWYGRGKRSLRLIGIVYDSNFLTWYNSLPRPQLWHQK